MLLDVLDRETKRQVGDIQRGAHAGPALPEGFTRAVTALDGETKQGQGKMADLEMAHIHVEKPSQGTRDGV